MMENEILSNEEYSRKVNESFNLDDKIKIWLKNGLSFTGRVGEVNYPDRELGLYVEDRLIILDVVTNPIIGYTVLENN